MNRAILVGNLCADPELTQTASGISVCRFSIAVNRTYTNANGEREADFIQIVTWRERAENCAKYLVKGSKVAICGQIQTRSYDDKNGNKRYVTEVVADDVEFVSSSNKDTAEGQRAGQKPQKKKASELRPLENDDLPF